MRTQLQTAIITCLILLLPAFVFASDSAMLTATGHTMVNGNNSPNSSALFAGDVVTTQLDSVASINAADSMVLVRAKSSVQFESSSVRIGHGSVVVTTSKAFAVRAGGLTVAPAVSQSSKYEVSERDGLIQIAARRGNLVINDGTSTSVLQEGQQASRQDSDQPNQKGADAPGNGFHLSKKAAGLMIGGAAAGTTVGIVLATRSGSHPVSPAVP